MVDEEDYHFFGAPLVDESDVQPFQRSDPAATRSLPLHQQEVKDDQGRRRFHGAFTGGYSAGYFNSVGSKEGWTPATFSSSQGARAGVRQSVEQFLDEDELEQYRKQHLQTTAAYDTFGATAAEASRRAVWEQAAIRPQAVPGLLPEDVIAPVADSVGIQLLRRMGWRQGRGLGGRPDAAGSRGAAGSEVISGTARETGAALASLLPPAPKTDLHGIGYDPFRGAREFEAAKRARLEAGRRQSGAAGPVPRRHPGVAFGTGVLEEDDAEGIMDDYVVHGDVGGEVESVNADARGLPARRGPGLQRAGLGDRLLAGGYSFEIQEEEEDEDEEEGRAPLLALTGARGPAMLTGRPVPAAIKSREHLARASFIPGFSRARRSTVTPSFPAPVIPRDWVSLRRRAKPPGASAPLPSRQATPALLARVAPPSDPALRQAIDSLAFYVARSGGASEDLARSTQVQNGAGHSFLLGGPGSAYYAWKVHTLRELMAPGQTGRDQGPSAGPPAAPERKAAFTSAEERGRALGETPLPSQPGAVDAAAVSGAESSRGGPPAPRRDLLLSVAAADRLRLAGMLSRSFVSGSAECGDAGASEVPAGLRPGARPERPPGSQQGPPPAALGPAPAPVGAVPRAAGHIVTAADLSRAGGFGGEDKQAPGAAPRLPIRRSKEWRPAALLCKRFNVPDPFHGRPREVEPSRFKTDFLALPDTAAAAVAQAAAKLGPGAAELLAPPAPRGGAAEAAAVGDAAADAELAAERFLADLLGQAAEPEELPPLPPAPPMDLFKAIFEDDEEEEEEEMEEGARKPGGLEAGGGGGDASVVLERSVDQGRDAHPSGGASERREPQADFGFSKLRSERGSVRGAGAEDSAGPRLAEDPAPAAGGIHGLDPALRQRVESTLKSLGKRERKENKRSKEKRSKHHKSSKVDRREKGSRSKRRRRSRSASQ
ncbi:hypothetical protein ACKKBG_A05050 [Auxenochlorella protothecoides x Auxenochlorella symbiontica]